MIIIPDRNIPRARFLVPVKSRQWREPSQLVPRDQMGNPTTQTHFRIRARLNDGHVAWTGWFADREDFDAFLWAIACGTLRYERELWRLPTPAWHPDIGENVTFDFLTQTILTTTGSNQTYTSPSDWNNSSNTVECLGAGGSGAARSDSTGHQTGGGGGAYSSIANFSFATPGTTTATYRVGSAGPSRSTTNSNLAGLAGGATWWNDTVDPGNGSTNAKCSAAGGGAGANGTGSQNGGTGGATTSSWGQTKNAGGRGGNLTGASGAGGSGGGGAAGPSGAGGAGTDSASTSNVATAGGDSNNGTLSGGAGSTTTATAGSNGTEFSGSYGCGSGGGGASRNTASAVATAGAGGNYGAGGGGAVNSSASSLEAVSGAGTQGLIVVEYTPAVTFSLANTNLPMMGL